MVVLSPITAAVRSRRSGAIAGAAAALRRSAGGSLLRRAAAESFSPATIACIRAAFLLILFSLSFILIGFSRLWAATPAGTVITNTATVVYTPSTSSVPVTVTTNPVSVTTTLRRTVAVLELLQYAPAAPGAEQVLISPTVYSSTTTTVGPFLAEPAPIPAGSTTAISLLQPVPLIPATQLHMDDPLFIRLTDGDQNNDPAVAEAVLVTIRNPSTGDLELLRLTETGPNTGVFTGYAETDAQPGATGNGILNTAVQTSIAANYVDAGDSTDTEAGSVLVDPYGIVFNSTTGAPVDGATVTIVDAATGNPATVYGDDGVSTFPSSVTTGGTVQDSSGKSYAMAPGSYRFPFIRPGQYSLQVIPPAGYRAPSQISDSALQQLPGGPFALATPGSRGENFTVNPGPSIHVDIPIDPTTSLLYLVKTAGKQTVAMGDFVPYKLTVQNLNTAGSMTGVIITDRLPAGFRYRKGSARLNNTSLSDPLVSPDGRGLTFSLGALAAAGTAEVRYVAEAGAGARPGTAVNTAVAQGSGGAVSNNATASVLVTEDLLAGKATVVGRVFDGCDRTGEGVAGVRIYLEDGTYVVTDRNGMYHFEAVNPGSHVVQLDTVTVSDQYEIAACEENTGFAGTPFSQFIDLQGGTLWRADFYLALKPRASGEVGIELRTGLAGKTMQKGDLEHRAYAVGYAVPIHVGSVPARNMRLTIMLPDGVSYVPGSAKLNGAPLPDPEITPGAVTFRLADAPADWEGTVRFDARAEAAGTTGDLVSKAILALDTPRARNVRTPVVDTVLTRQISEVPRSVPDIVLHPNFATLSAELTAKDKKDLDRVVKNLRKLVLRSITITGHTDSQQIRGKGRKKFADNYALSRARAESVARYLASKLKLESDQMTIVGKGPDEPVASNKTVNGRARNRRVEFKVVTQGTVQRPELRTEKDSSGMKAVATEGLRPGEEWRAAGEQAKNGDGRKTMPDYDLSWINQAQPGLAWIWPADGYHPAIPSARIAIKHDPRQTLKLFLNGEELNGLYLDGTIRRQDGLLALSMWRGIHLQDGDNIFEAVTYDENGAETGRLKRVMHYSTPPVQAALVPERSRLEADGKRPPVIAIRLTDKDGHPAREGIFGEFSVDPPHLPNARIENLQQSPVVESPNKRLKYEVGEDGIALIELEPTMQSGEAVVRVPLAAGSQEVRAWLRPEDRDWILVGLAEGTVGYNVASGNMESLGAAGQDEQYYDDGRVAFYAKGKIKGEWLLTMAYDSAKQTTDGRPGLYQTIDPNQYYVLYGDGSQQRYDASSAKKLYLKIERDRFYALFGDYATGMSVTELSRYNRNFTGLKSELKAERYEYTAFVSESNQAYVRDEIRGEGTSGMYRLSRRNIVLNSESVTLETRDRFRSEVIVSVQRLSRFLDYSIDYDTGELWFKSPVYGRDADLNPIFIVAEYESYDAADTSYNYGGRGAVRLLNNKLEVGGSLIHEGRVGGSGNLEGADVTYTVDRTTTIRAEAAATRTDQAGGSSSGSAYLAEVQHHSEKADGSIYVREQAAGFGLGQQNGSESGTRKAGFDLSYRISGVWTLGSEAYRQENLSTGAVRHMIEVREQYTKPRYALFTGLRHAEDKFTSGEVDQSDQLFAGGSYQFTEKLAGRMRYDQSLSNNENSDFPTRVMAGLDYRLSNAVSMFAEQERTWGANEDTSTSRAGMRAAPWTGAEMTSTVQQQSTEYGPRTFATTGLRQAWQINKNWSMDAGLERSDTIRHPGNRSLNVNVPPASGGPVDFTAASVGAGYQAERWSWTGRVEKRFSDQEDKLGIFSGANGEVREGLGLAAGLQMFHSSFPSGGITNKDNLRFGLAYRPRASAWIVLDRLDLLLDEQTGSAFTYDNWRIVNNLVVNFKSSRGLQVSIQYAAKYVRETIDGADYRSYTDLTALETLYNLSKKWDIGIKGRLLHSWAVGEYQTGAGVSTGYNAAKNLLPRVGYNFTGFTDRDFSRADFTSKGPFIKFSLKFDQVSAREAVKWITGQ